MGKSTVERALPNHSDEYVELSRPELPNFDVPR
jgi:hypothetical protein